MDLQTKDQATKFLVGVASVITTVLGSGTIVDYRAEERVQSVTKGVEEIASQNQIILKDLSSLVSDRLEKLNKTSETVEVSNELNKEILDLAKQRLEMHKKEVSMLKDIQAEMNKIKRLDPIKGN
jgi:hypothetical protein